MPDAGVAPAVSSALPTLKVDGREDASLGARLRTMVVEETVEGLKRCELSFLNWGPRQGREGFLFFDRQTLDFGKPVKLEVGSSQAAGVVFDGKITGIEGRFLRERDPEILVLAEDKLQELRMTRRTRTFSDVSDADIFQQVATSHGLRVQADVDGPTHRAIAQLNQSDLAFLRERARAADAELWVEDTMLHVVARARRRAGEVKLTYQSGLHEFSVLADLAGQCTGFTVSGWDVAAKEAITSTAKQSVLGAELNGDLAGERLLDQVFGAREQQIVHFYPVTSQEATALAEGAYRRAARRFLTGWGITDADSRIRAGTRLELAGVGEMFDGHYYVSRVRHSFDLVHGTRTAFAVERAGVKA